MEWSEKSFSGMTMTLLIRRKPDSKSHYKFAGVFENGKMDFCNHTYRRIATKIRLVGNPVTSIKITDDDKKNKKARTVVKA